MKTVVLISRILYSWMFIMSGIGHLTNPGIKQYAASAGVPAAGFLVPLSGLMILLGGISIILGFKARLGAWLMVLFLIPVTFTIHRFWGLADQQMTMVQMSNFFKNISMLGAALMLTYFGSGPLSMRD